MAKKMYPLPKGVRTNDLKLFEKEWARLTPIIEDLLPGYKVSAACPGFTLTRWEKNRWGDDTVKESVQVSDRFIEILHKRIHGTEMPWTKI